MKKSATFIILFFLVCSVNAQLKEAQSKKIDSLFGQWVSDDLPGGAVGISIDGTTVYSNAFGQASLEYGVANTNETIFNTGSVSKQFTAMGIVLLEQEGQLSVDDDIRKYLPEIPEFENTITIRHMLHHTSGLRSLHAMLELAGWRGDDTRTNEDLNRFMTLQQELNFVPGDEYAYCNTGYMLMVNIIEKVSGQKFPIWMKQHIFDPLGMPHTYVEDRYNRVVKNNATSYYKNQEQDFVRAVEYWGYVGSGNMHSTTADLLKWLQNFHSPQAGWDKAFGRLQTLDNFNDGTKNEYAFGLVVDQHHGRRRVQHGGAIGGYRAYVSVYPEEKLSIAVLANFPTATGAKAAQIAELILPAPSAEVSENGSRRQRSRTVKLKAAELKKYEASFWNDKENYARKIYFRNDTLRYFRSENNESPILPLGGNRFKMHGVPSDLQIVFEFKTKGTRMLVSENDGPTSVFDSYEPVEDQLLVKETYTGKFYSPELETTYDIYAKGDSLYGHHARHGDFKMTLLKQDVLQGEWPLLIAKYQRNANNVITGLRVSNGRVRELWFEKID